MTAEAVTVGLGAITDWVQMIVKLMIARLVTAAAVLLLVAPLSPEAQPVNKTYRIGWLAPAAIPENLDAFRSGLRALGYVEGNNVALEQRYAVAKLPLAAAAAEVVRLNPDVIVTDGSSAAIALKPTVGSIPVVLVSGDPVGWGLAPSLSRPGHMTGLGSRLVGPQREAAGTSQRGVPANFAFGRPLRATPRQEHDFADRSGSALAGPPAHPSRGSGVDDIEPAFGVAIRERVDAVMPVSSALFDAEKHRLVSLAAKHRLPTMYEHRAYPEADGLMSYGPDIHDVFRRAAGYVDRILKGAKPADLPIEQPTKFEFVINMKTAKTLRLTIPPSVLLRADRVIE